MKKILLNGLIMSSVFCSCASDDQPVEDCQSDSLFCDTTLVSIMEDHNSDLKIREGVISQKEQTIRVLRDGKPIALVELGEPQKLVQANQWVRWGYYQFPRIFRAENNNIIVYWQMKIDSHTTYGIEGYDYRMSRDEGITWEPLDKEYYRRERDRIEFENGDVLQEYTPESKSISDYPEFPAPVNSTPIASSYNFYLESECPEELRGVYLSYWNRQTGESSIIHGSLNDPGYLRYAVDGMMPVVWWGNIKQLKGGELVTGVYPGIYQNSSGTVLRGGVSFYKSSNKGLHWDVIGKIPCYRKGESGDFAYDGKEGFSEPTFEILKDSTFICVMRTGSGLPMYRSFSKDKGKTWTEPEPFTPNGVRPHLMLLGNGVLVLVSGRPGMQIRLNIDGDGQTWTEPIDMMPFVKEDGTYIQDVSCGYPSILRVDDNTFYMVYSDFFTNGVLGSEEKKAIYFRTVKIKRR